MPILTPNYNLKKPLQTENYNVDDNNFNADIVDTELKKINDAIGILKTTQDITYYVSVTGSDTTGTGTNLLPFKTIQFAIDKLPQIINHTVIINVSDGNYPEYVQINGFSGKGRFTLKGGTNLGTAVNFLIQKMLISNCTIRVEINGFISTTTTISDIAFCANNCTWILFYYCLTTVSATTVKGFAFNNSLAWISNCQASNKGVGLAAYQLSTVLSGTWMPGSGNIQGIYSAYGSTVAKDGVQPQGTTAEISGSGGVIR